MSKYRVMATLYPPHKELLEEEEEDGEEEVK
jgi:hypothetical protein